MALLQAEWERGDEEKLGFVWTFESCLDTPWLRLMPEILPYEWFRRDAQDHRQHRTARAHRESPRTLRADGAAAASAARPLGARVPPARLRLS
jgi:hypothetical protein